MNAKTKNQIVKALEAKVEQAMERSERNDYSVSSFEWLVRSKKENGKSIFSINVYTIDIKKGAKVRNSTILHGVEELMNLAKWYNVGWYVTCKHYGYKERENREEPVPEVTLY